jgi:phosphoribosylaminoimidazolecarboxamide formyltransferase/IMP cyclohydrolase
MTLVTATANQAGSSEKSGRRPVPRQVTVRNALISVFDKDRLDELLALLSGRGVTIWSTGGTFREIESLQERFDYRLEAISDLTGYPEMPGGLVKTLHPKIHAGILAEPFKEDQDAYLDAIGAVPFDLVVCNLYPFERVSKVPDVSVETLRQTIDIGGPTMLRAAAKNFLRVTTVVDPADYSKLAQDFELHHGAVSMDTRWHLAKKAFEHVRHYDDAISLTLASLDPAKLTDAYQVIG